MRLDFDDISAAVYRKNEDKNIYYIKISSPRIGMYIRGVTVRPSAKYGDLWFQMPAYLLGGKWIRPIEFSSDSQFGQAMKDASMRAVEEYNHEADDILAEYDNAPAPRAIRLNHENA